MARYIDADRLIKGIRDAVERIKPNEYAKEIVEDAITLLQNEPTADVVEVKHGEWIKNVVEKHGIYRPTFICSKCGKRRFVLADYNFCPHCGAKMDGGKANDL